MKKATKSQTKLPPLKEWGRKGDALTLKKNATFFRIYPSATTGFAAIYWDKAGKMAVSWGKHFATKSAAKKWLEDQLKK